MILAKEVEGVEGAMAEKHCDEGDLLDLATFVAEKLHRVHGIERAPALDDYRVEQVAIAGEAPRIMVQVDLGRGLVITLNAAWRADGELGAERVARRVALPCRGDPEREGTRASGGSEHGQTPHHPGPSGWNAL